MISCQIQPRSTLARQYKTSQLENTILVLYLLLFAVSCWVILNWCQSVTVSAGTYQAENWYVFTFLLALSQPPLSVNSSQTRCCLPSLLSTCFCHSLFGNGVRMSIAGGFGSFVSKLTLIACSLQQHRLTFPTLKSLKASPQSQCSLGWAGALEASQCCDCKNSITKVAIAILPLQIEHINCFYVHIFVVYHWGMIFPESVDWQKPKSYCYHKSVHQKAQGVYHRLKGSKNLRNLHGTI